MKKILCVEDEPHLRADLAEELEAAGYDVCTAADGRAALEAVETFRPDLVLCDIILPHLGGHEVLEQVRRTHPDMADMPVIFLTALGSRDDVISGKRAGVDDYLVKPIDFDLMLASIEACLTRVEQMRRQRLDSLRESWQQVQAGAVSAGALEVLNLLALGVVLVGRDGEVIFANAAARQLTEDKDGIAVGERVRIATRSHAERLRRMLSGGGAAASDDDGIAGMALPRP
ncbi:MAG: response regulator, partial [Paracoccaceae bacterium]